MTQNFSCNLPFNIDLCQALYHLKVLRVCINTSCVDLSIASSLDTVISYKVLTVGYSLYFLYYELLIPTYYTNIFLRSSSSFSGSEGSSSSFSGSEWYCFNSLFTVHAAITSFPKNASWANLIANFTLLYLLGQGYLAFTSSGVISYSLDAWLVDCWPTFLCSIPYSFSSTRDCWSLMILIFAVSESRCSSIPKSNWIIPRGHGP